MLVTNITASFCVIRIYPLYRSATAVITKKPKSPNPSGLKFLSVCSPTPHKQALQVAKKVSTFTQQELEDFEKRYTEETAETNACYNEW